MDTPEPLTPDDWNRLLAEGPSAPAYECYDRWGRWHLANNEDDGDLTILELIEIYAAWSSGGGWERALAERGVA